MEQQRANRRLIAILFFGVLVCAVAFGVRLFHRKPIHGTWMGYSYLNIDGEMVADKEFGQYVIQLWKDGTYEENGNSTSGLWTRTGDRITLKPLRFYDMTPEEHRKKYRKKDGKVSVTIERLLAMRMKPMTISYVHVSDRLVYKEPTLHFEYERLN